MKSFHCIAAACALSLTACQASEEPVTPEPEETADADSAAPAMGPDGLPAYGLFEITSADGETVLIEDVKEDGTMTNTVEGGEPVAGTWEMGGANIFCVTLEMEEEATCYRDELDEDGVWITTNVADPNDSWTVKRIAAEEASDEGA